MCIDLNRNIKDIPVVTVVTQVRVDENDPAFQNPTKPIGHFMTKEEADFADFLSKAEPGLVIPGLAENLIPQGMDQCDETGILYISGYYTTDGKSSAILAVDTATGELTAEYILLNAGGTPFDGHVGGVAVSEDTLYVSGQKQNGLYTICAIPLKDLPAEGSHEVKLEQTIPVLEQLAAAVRQRRAAAQ